MPKREKKEFTPLRSNQEATILTKSDFFIIINCITGIKQQRIICQAWNSFQSLLLLFPKSLLPSTVTQGRNLEVICNSLSPALFYPSRQPIFIKSLNVLANLLGTRDTTMTKKKKL